MNKPVLRVCNLNFSDGETDLLRNINFTVGRGEKFAILGPNGAGKSILVDCLLDNLPYDPNAVIEVFGSPIRKERHRVGVLYEVFASFPLLKVSEILDLIASIHRIGNTDEYARALYATLKIDELADKLFIVMSKGERQRVGIYAAMFFGPELVIFDEPTSGLDPLMRESFWKIVAQSEATIVYISHHWKEVAKEADQVLFLDGGALVTPADSPGNILERLPFRRKIVVEKLDALVAAYSQTETVLRDEDSVSFLFSSEVEKRKLLRDISQYTTSYSLFDLDLKDAFKYLTRNGQKTQIHELSSIHQAV